jgi:hypothetical protein
MTDQSAAPLTPAIDPKSILTSKTFWTNVVALVAVLAGAHKLVLTPDQQATMVGVILTVVNIVLRIFTKGPVTVPGVKASIFIPLFVVVLAACSPTSTTAVVADGIVAAPGAISTVQTLTSSATPAQKFSAACDEYWAGSAQLDPLIQALIAKQGAGAATAYKAAQVVLTNACAKNPDGTYVNATAPTLASLIPQVLGAAGQLTVLFLPQS